MTQPITHYRNVRIPSKATLKKYGLSFSDWQAIIDRQGAVCYICKRLPASGKLAIEHQHIKGWSKMAPNERKRYVRGACDYVCNTQYLGRGLTLEKARNVVRYLEEFEYRLNGLLPDAAKPANDNWLSAYHYPQPGNLDRHWQTHGYGCTPDRCYAPANSPSGYCNKGNPANTEDDYSDIWLEVK